MTDERMSWSLVLFAACLLAAWGPGLARAQEDVNQLKAELEAQKQHQADLENKINQLEARQNLKEKAMNEKLEQAAAQKPPAEAEARKEEKKEGYYFSERRYGSFQRAFRVPDGVDADKIEASFEKGVLTVRLPKTPEAVKEQKTIEVKSK